MVTYLLPMRVGVIADIHGNGVALEAVLADVSHNPVDRWVCLGDAVQGGVQPLEVAERLAELGCPVIIGNADAFVLESTTTEVVEEIHSTVGRWTLQTLGPRGVDLVRSYVQTYELDLEGAGTLLCFHGTPGSFDGVLAPSTPAHELRSELSGHGARLLCGGHIHRQWIVSLDDWTFFNPGSVGMAYNFHLPEDEVYIYPFAEYAIISTEDDDPRIEFCQAPYDVDAIDRVARASGHPYADSQAARYRPRR
jgi:predicted phosphodiesterase